ncbi:unnamed protein product [Ixodes pacificus]
MTNQPKQVLLHFPLVHKPEFYEMGEGAHQQNRRVSGRLSTDRPRLAATHAAFEGTLATLTGSTVATAKHARCPDGPCRLHPSEARPAVKRLPPAAKAVAGGRVWWSFGHRPHLVGSPPKLLCSRSGVPPYCPIFFFFHPCLCDCVCVTCGPEIELFP